MQIFVRAIIPAVGRLAFRYLRSLQHCFLILAAGTVRARLFYASPLFAEFCSVRVARTTFTSACSVVAGRFDRKSRFIHLVIPNVAQYNHRNQLTAEFTPCF